EDQTAFLVLLLEDECLDQVTDGDDLVGVDVMLDGELTRGDDALGLVADVEQNLIAVDLDDRPLDDVAVVEELQGLLDRGQEVLGRSDVVDRDLLGGRGGRCGSHVVGCPSWLLIGPRHALSLVSRGQRSIGRARRRTPERSGLVVVRCHGTGVRACAMSHTCDTPGYQNAVGACDVPVRLTLPRGADRSARSSCDRGRRADTAPRPRRAAGRCAALRAAAPPRASPCYANCR